LGERVVVGGAGGLHGVEDEVGGAVDDAGDTQDVVTGEGTTQHADDRDGGGDGGLEVEVHVGGVGRVGEVVGVGGDEGLVGGDDGLAGAQGGQDQLARVVDAADDLDDDVDVLAVDEAESVIGEQLPGHALTR